MIVGLARLKAGVGDSIVFLCTMTDEMDAHKGRSRKFEWMPGRDEAPKGYAHKRKFKMGRES